MIHRVPIRICIPLPSRLENLYLATDDDDIFFFVLINSEMQEWIVQY
jgi:hypothetical protein